MIEKLDGRNHVCCDHCPASYPNTYADEDFRVMIADAKTAGWKIVKAMPDDADGEGTAELFGAPPRIAGKKHDRQGYLHICPDCHQHLNCKTPTLL